MKLLFIFLLLSATLVAQEPHISPATRTELETAIVKFMSATHAPGISVAVVEHGAEVWSEGFGFADLENSVPATRFTLYRLASMSKPLTATAAMLLWERGKLDLDAPIQKYCPRFPQK